MRLLMVMSTRAALSCGQLERFIVRRNRARPPEQLEGVNEKKACFFKQA